jgi:MerR family mercuric resistance operon transcriptional regulator
MAMGDHNSAKTLNRTALAQRTGCHIETIRYYEGAGLMPDPRPQGRGYRQYAEQHVARLRFILRARELGFTMDDVRGLLGLIDAGTQTCAEVKARTDRHLMEVRMKISDLKKIEEVLAETSARCDRGTAPQCAILDALAG